jgi:cytochrome c553
MAALLWVFMASDAIAWYPATYAESAHGDPISGVNRSEAGHDIGHCANCHDTFSEATCGDNLFMLFAPTNADDQIHNFCFQCHKGEGSVQEGEGGITNYTYSKNFGGGDATFTTIYDAFNTITGSSHNLKDIQNYVTGIAGFTSDSNPCVVCHNPHTAQDNHPVTVYETLGGVNTAIRRPLDYQDRNTNLWGDEDYITSGYEMTKDLLQLYGYSYQAPYFGDKTDPDWEVSYEPAGDATSDGSNLPNFITFCIDCHGADVPSVERGRPLRKIDWANAVHGSLHNFDAPSPYARIAPYADSDFNYVLICTDCHEPHGSQNEWLLRTTINGKNNISVTVDGEWSEVCNACHTGDFSPSEHEHAVYTTCYGGGPEDGDWACHFHGEGLLGVLF